MPLRPLIGLGSVALVTLALALGAARDNRAQGPAQGAATVADPDSLLAEAQALVDAGRPWRAAQVLRQYREAVPAPPASVRLLAARAEGASGAWAEVRTLLEGVPGLDTLGGGDGAYLLGRARAAGGDARGAVEAYRMVSAPPPRATFDAERAAAQLHLGLALLQTGDRAEARRALEAATVGVEGEGAWLPLLETDALALAGDTAGVRRAIGGASDSPRETLARIEAARRAGDLAGARRLAERARTRARADDARAQYLLAAGRLALEAGDRSEGRAALRGVIALGADGPPARQAATLLAEGPMTAADHLAVARAERAQGLYEEAAAGFRHWLDAGDGAPGTREGVAFEYAEALFRATRFDEAAEALRSAGGGRDARMLAARTEGQRGHADEAVRRYLAIADDLGATENGRQALLLAADARHHAGETDAARVLYERVLARHPGSEQAGLARMRLGGLAFLAGDEAEAARHWDAYRTAEPRGPLALQATYWAGRARAAQGDAAGAAALYRAVRSRDRDSYYALLASEALGEPFWPLPLRDDPSPSPAATARAEARLRGADLLAAAGFADEAAAEANRVAAAGGDVAAQYALGEALVARGYGRPAIRIGLALQRSEPSSRRLLRLVYPFPYRDLVTAEARERGLDPFVVAALIRQESLFEAGVTSPAGARGLMQVMPATGREVADSLGVRGFDPEALYRPEVSLHIGTAYVGQQAARSDGRLPAIFAAYNAGPHRVAWWSRYPEFAQSDEVFTERIPFRETRDYVKILTRNRALYRGLYGREDTSRR